MQRRLQPRRLPLDHRKRLADLAGDHRRHRGFEDAGLLGGDFLDRVAQKFAVIERQPRDDARQRPLDDIGGVEPAAQPDFKQQNIGGMAREQQKPRGGLDLEHGNRRIAVFGLTFGERRGKLVIADEFAAVALSDAEALVEANEIGRGIDMHASYRPLRGWRA